MARKKAASLPIPETADEAAQLMARYVERDRLMLEQRLRFQMTVDQGKKELECWLAEQRAAQAEAFASLQAWWQARGASEIAGRKRSAEFAGGKIGVRLSTPAVVLAKGLKEAAVVTWLQGLRWIRAAEFLRRGPVKLDKSALIKAAQADPELRQTFAGKGVTVEQADEFFIDTGIDEEAMRKELAAAG